MSALVTLELRHPAAMVETLREAAENDDRLAAPLLNLADQIEAQTRPLKPAEPTGLGAVVEDEQGRRWVRVNETLRAHWRPVDAASSSPFRNYVDIDAVRVLSEGVIA